MTIYQFVFDLIRLIFMRDMKIRLENISLRSQLAEKKQKIITGKIPKPQVDDAFRKLWVFMSMNYTDWKHALVLVKPDTVKGWFDRLYKSYWRRKSKGGRPGISMKTINLIRRIHKENPTLSPEKIHERLLALNITDAPAPNTISKYIKDKRKPPSERQMQSWQTFLSNHAKGIWSMDFAACITLTFKPLYVLFIMSHGRRRIEHFAITENPDTVWVKQQIREATPFGKHPGYLIHDNSPVFTEKSFKTFLSGLGIVQKRITPGSPWQNGICERMIGTVRRELFDHIIPLNQRHLQRLLTEYVDYYNNVRTHQALDGETPAGPEPPPPTTVRDTVLSASPILGGLYHSYEKHSRHIA
jgi:transposase InsO family protein